MTTTAAQSPSWRPWMSLWSVTAHTSPSCRVSRCNLVRSSKLKLIVHPVSGAPHMSRPDHARLCNISWHGPLKNAVTAAANRRPLPNRSPVRQLPGEGPTVWAPCASATSSHYSRWTGSTGPYVRPAHKTMVAAKLEPPPGSHTPGSAEHQACPSVVYVLPHGAVHHTLCHPPT